MNTLPGDLSGNGSHQLQPLEGRVTIRRDGRFSGQIFFMASVGSNMTCGCNGPPLRIGVFIPLAGAFNTVMRGSVTEDGFQSTYSFRGE